MPSKRVSSTSLGRRCTRSPSLCRSTGLAARLGCSYTLGVRLLLSILLLCCTACPGFEDEYSGTYRQVIDDDSQVAEPIAVEVFRYGHNIHTMVRFYEGDADPFAREARCAWTEPAVLSDDDTFETLVRNTTPQVRLSGRFESDGTLKARINAAGGNSPDFLLKLEGATPDDTCRTIQPRSVTAEFSLSSPNEFGAGEYELENPYFGIQWIAVQPIETGTIRVWTAFTPELVFVPIRGNVTSNRRGLSGSLGLLVEPPDDEYRTRSGSTRYSLAHFIVVDDDPDDDSFVGWDRETEPIIASGVRAGRRVEPPPGAEDHNHYGQALLFVEGRLDALGNLGIQIVEADIDRDGKPDPVDPTAHFYVVDVFAKDERIVALRLAPSTALTIPVAVTSEYLNETGLVLPRLFPLD